MFRRSKKAMLDDLFDISFLVVGLFLGVLFLSSVLIMNATSKTDASIDQINTAYHQTLILNYLSQPIEISGQKITMKEAILLAVNTDDQTVVETSTKEYFTNSELNSKIVIYDKNEYLSKGNNIYLWENIDGFTELTETHLHLPNPTSQEIPEVTVVMNS